MSIRYVIIVLGEPNSVFSEILIKTLNKIKIKNPLIVISCKKLLKLQMKKLNLKKNIKLLDYKKLDKYNLNNNSINLIDVNSNQKNAFEKISDKSQNYVKNSFDMAFRIIKKRKISKFINGPISKKYFFNKKYLGVTEYISDYFNENNTCMLIYNKNLSVCPVTTHLPLKLVAKKINKQNILNKVILIQKFYKKFQNKNPKIAILGLNPHCESILNYNG